MNLRFHDLSLNIYSEFGVLFSYIEQEPDLKVKKHKIPMIFIKVVMIITILALPQAFAVDKLAIFGDLRGHFEPCGCDPRTDVGGVKRIGAAVFRYRGLYSNLIVVSTGNFQIYGKDQSAVAKIMDPALEVIAPDVVLLNHLEWSALKSKQALPNLPWVLSNYRGKSYESLIKPAVLSRGTEFFGILAEVDSDLEPVSHALSRRFMKTTRVSSAERRVLIYSGPISKIAALVSGGFFGTIILSNPTKLGLEIGDTERSKENSLLFNLPGKRTAYAVPFGGAGLLRLGGLELMEFPKTVSVLASRPGQSSSSLLSAAKPAQNLSDSSIPLARFFHWLDLTEESAVPKALLNLTETARKKDQENFQALAILREKDLANSEFVGAKSCEGCHKSSYDAWTKSKHASALATLAMKQRQEEPHCVECHVLGYTAKGGYVSEDKSPHFANVQCENCHGPRKAHVSTPTLSPGTKASASCAMCHTPPHSPGFEYKSYWKQIEHK
jgi:hypothetical protein